MRSRHVSCPDMSRFAIGAVALTALMLALVGRVDAFEEILKDRDGLAMEGFDATAYLDSGGPREGAPAYTVEWKGAEWRFATQEAADAFAAAPETFTPRFGGYCTGAMSYGKTSRGDPGMWRLRGGKLYLFQSRRGPVRFDKDPDKTIFRAEKHWKRLTGSE